MEESAVVNAGVDASAVRRVWHGLGISSTRLCVAQ